MYAKKSDSELKLNDKHFIFMNRIRTLMETKSFLAYKVYILEPVSIYVVIKRRPTCRIV